MNIENNLRSLLILFFFMFSLSSYSQTNYDFEGSKADRDALISTGNAIRLAFSNGNVDSILLYHHPDVIKAINYNTVQKGKESLRPGLKGTLDSFHLEFIQNKIESLLINGDTAIEQTLFTIKGTPKGTGDSFIFKGRSMIVYVRYKESPTGWATIREIIQPTTDK